MASVDTDNEKRNDRLKSADFFDIAKYPHITFKSTFVKYVECKKCKVIGNLFMHHVTKAITLDLILNGIGKNMIMQKPIAGFNLRGIVNRAVFRVGKVPAAIVSENVEIKVNGEFEQE